MRVHDVTNVLLVVHTNFLSHFQTMITPEEMTVIDNVYFPFTTAFKIIVNFFGDLKQVIN